MAATVEIRAARGALRFDGLRRAALVGLWALVIAAVGVGVALPEEFAQAALGTLAVGAAILTFIQPLVGLLLVLVVVPFGTRASASDTSAGASTDASVGAAEMVVALLVLAWLARGIRRRELNIQTGAIVVAILAMVALAGCRWATPWTRLPRSKKRSSGSSSCWRC